MLRPGLMLGVVAVAAALPAVACSGGDAGPSRDEGSTRTVEVGGVTVEGNWLTARSLGDVEADLAAYSLDKYVLVEIDFTTHTGNLNEIDMEQASGLRQDDEAIAPVAWVSISDDSHHRAGVLAFERRAAEGPAELTLDMGDEEAALLWESPPT